jgi:ElaB/YqjD/DUF883 family membrane-anchored ribosome-binding protein
MCRLAITWNALTLGGVVNHIHPNNMESTQMTGTERSTYPHGTSGGATAADPSTDDLSSRGAATLREVKANVESVIADAEDKGQQALNYAGRKGQEAMDNVREVGDAIEKSVTKRPYATLGLAVGLGFLFGATWRR